ncbi:hypothetical protein SEA_PUREGLOBE5_110 [Arthrobacter phage Pureglobe5]|nr:hypothetical protein PBI_BEAGLE_112 [Arthrobacter phage Beagle]QOP66858.1 membrane protein [Arthrobacter phage Odyssey395]UYL87473.1 hypothetical protein SEA_PUREGLOBE5_110 [Arthrobacter phage Pureglobe5]
MRPHYVLAGAILGGGLAGIIGYLVVQWLLGMASGVSL